MRRTELVRYEEQERALARQLGKRSVEAGVVTSLKPVFEDLHCPKDLGALRRGAHLGALTLLYPATTVFVPPSTEQILRQRLGMSLTHFLELADRGIVKPLIGHPSEYADLPHLDGLLHRRPASVWARGDEVAHAFADAAEYWLQARKFLDLDGIKVVRWVRRKWKSQSPFLSDEELSRKIETEICTNFVNLCIFGYEPLARQIAALPHPGWTALRLLEMNEVIAYPELICIGGTPNYGLHDRELIEQTRASYLIPGRAEFLPASTEFLMSGLNLRLPHDLSADAIVEFHNTGAAKHLWKALRAVEGEIERTPNQLSIPRLAEAANDFKVVAQRSLDEARDISFELSRRRIRDRAESVLELGVKAGSTVSIGVAAGAYFGPVVGTLAAAMAGIGLTNITTGTKAVKDALAKLSDAITDHLLSRKFSPAATHLWWVERQFRPEARGRSEKKRPSKGTVVKHGTVTAPSMLSWRAV